MRRELTRILIVFTILPISTIFGFAAAGKDQDSHFWLFSTRGQLRRDAPAGSFVLFDGPMRVSAAIPQTKSISLFVSEPFLLRQHFSITPSSTLSPGQPFQLLLLQPLPPHITNNASTVVLTLQAQLMPHSGNDEQESMVLRVERIELQIELVDNVGEGRNNRGNVISDENGAERVILMKKDPKNCSVYTSYINDLVDLQEHSILGFFGPSSNKFKLKYSNENPKQLQLLYNDGVGSKCAPSLKSGSNSKNNILTSSPGPFGMNRTQIWTISFQNEEETDTTEHDPKLHFSQHEFTIYLHPEQRTVTPPLVLLEHVRSKDIAGIDLNGVGFQLENGKDKVVQIHPKTGMVTVKNFDGLINVHIHKVLNTIKDLAGESLPIRNGNVMDFAAFLTINGIIADRMNISVKIAEDENPMSRRDEQIRFDRSIYAFAVDPYNSLGKSGSQMLVGKVGTTPAFEDGNHGVEFLISEGGAGLFAFGDGSAMNGTYGGGRNALHYRGPLSQFPRNYTLKVLMKTHDIVDSATVHVLVAGIGSSPPQFQHSFQRILVPKYNFAQNDADPQGLFTLSAEDSDPDAHLVYALESAKCKGMEGKTMENECTNAFALSPNGTGQWVLSLIDNGGEEFSEALVNISVQDKTHLLEAKGFTLVLLKFIQQTNQLAPQNGTEHTNLGSNNNFSPKFADPFFNTTEEPFVLHLQQGMPVNSLVYSFGVPMGNDGATSVRYSLVGQMSKYFAIGRDSGLLTIAHPFRNATGLHQLTVNALINGTQLFHRPITIEIVDKLANSNTSNWPKFEQNFYTISLDDKGKTVGEDIRLVNAGIAEMVELIVPTLNGSSRNVLLEVDENGTIHMDNIFKQYMDESNFFLAASTNITAHNSIIPLHIDRDMPKQFTFTPLTPMPDGPIEVPENTPVGTFLLSVDFNAVPPLAEFRISKLFGDQNSSTQFLDIERRASSIFLRTNRRLKGMASLQSQQNPMEFALMGNGTEIGRFGVHILPTATCEPRFKRGQQLVFGVKNDSLSQLTPQSAQWLPIGTLSAELEETANGCGPLKYGLEQGGERVRVDPRTGVLSFDTTGFFNTPNVGKPISLIAFAQSNTYTARIRLQLELIGNNSSTQTGTLHFLGGRPTAPIRLEIEEGVPAGTRLTAFKAIGSGGNEENLRYRLEGPDTDLLAVDAESGELKTLRDLDFEALNDRQLPLQMLVIAEALAGDEPQQQQKAELEFLLDVIDINDNSPVFERALYSFVAERDAPVGHVLGKMGACDADQQNSKQPQFHLLSCHFHYGRFSRQITPANRTFSLNPHTGEIVVAAPVDDSPGAHFTLLLQAEDEGGRRSVRNATVNIWIVDPSDIVSIPVDKSPVELDGRKILEYLSTLSAATSLQPLLQEVRYHIDSSDQSPVRHSSLLQLAFLNGTRVLTYEEVELVLRDVSGLQGMGGFEQNLYMQSSSSNNQRHQSQPTSAQQSQSSHLLSLSLLFLFLLATVLSVFAVLACQHRRRYIAQRCMAEAALAVRQASISKSDNELYKVAAAGYMLPPPPQFGEIWRRPLPPPPILPSLPPTTATYIAAGDAFYGATHAQQHSSDYYTVQEMKIAL